jgi:hypothetical protein
MVASEILSVFWTYLGQFFFEKHSETTHFKGILIRKIKKKYEKITTNFEVVFFTRVDLMWNNSIINILLFTQLSQLIEDYRLLLRSKPLEGYFFLENIDF